MASRYGKSEMDARDLDAEHELPPSAEGEAEVPAGTRPAGGRGGEAGSESELERLRAERDMLIDRLARSQAEFDNARKRAAREQQEFREYALADALRSLLPILDSFERALRTAPAEKSEFHNGVELIYKQMQDSLSKLGVRAIPAKGETFDPRLHEAIEMVESNQAKDHEVLEELQRGYKLKERLLRPAMVKVARRP